MQSWWLWDTSIKKKFQISYRPQTYEQLVYVNVSAKLTLYKI